MKIVVAGGGPAGLFFGVLARRQWPDAEVLVLERNPSGSTFGWGVVFSGRTLEGLGEADAGFVRLLEPNWRRWQDLAVVHRGEWVRVGGNHFAGVSRIDLLAALETRAREEGVEVRHGQEIRHPDELPAHDLLVAADGLRSVVREARRGVFEPSLDVRPNRYIWLGTPRLFDALTLIFRETEHGLFMAHAYRFSEGRSTFIVECDPETWHKAGLDELDEAASCRFLEEVFRDDLEGAPLLSNQSRWIQFTTVRNRRWQDGRTVLLGDAAHTAHFSIGSGTKLALEDAILLAQSLQTAGDIPAGLAAYEAARRPQTERLQAAAQSSLEWFEQARRYLHLDPLEFTFQAMTRSERIDEAGLRRRDPAFAARLEARGLLAPTAERSPSTP